MDREQLLKKIIIDAGKETLKFYGKKGVKYTTKSNIEDFVTEADLHSEKIIVGAIKKYFPEDGIISEESKDYKKSSEYVWIIDPLDGTWNFSKEIPLYGILIAVAKNDEVILGGSYFPYFNEFYFAAKGKGAYRNKKKITCSDKKDINHLRSTGYVQPEGYMEKEPVHRTQMMNLINKINAIDLWCTEFGCGAYDMALVASGRSHCFISPAAGGNVWDIAAPSIIMAEAGCKVTNFENKRWQLTDKSDIISANPYIHGQIMQIMNKSGKK
jgi:myo-inositol-1(or 4)-monophosphatase